MAVSEPFSLHRGADEPPVLRRPQSIVAIHEMSRHRLLGYGWFTEGFDTRDLKDAKALLDELKD